MVEIKAERFRTEILQEELFETQAGSNSAEVITAPREAKELYETWKSEDNGQPQVTRDASGRISELVRVAMGPAERNGKLYFSVRREVVYPHE